MNTLIIIIAILAVIVLYVIYSYNKLVTLVNKTKEAWSDISVQLQRRYDLIPNLVNTVKGYATHESSAFENVTKARAMSMSATGPEQKGQAEASLAGALKSVFALAEAYPELKANQNFLDLQQALADTEDKVQASRRYYNGNVRELNTGIQMFPGNIIANTFKFGPAEYFQLENDEAKKPVEVKF